MKLKLKKLMKNRKFKIAAIVVGILLLILIMRGCKPGTTIVYTTLPNGTIIATPVSSGGGGGGGGGSTAPSGTDGTGDDYSWWTWPSFDFFGFDIPNPLDDINWPDFPSSDDTESESFDTRTVLIDKSECTRNTDCMNLCSNPTYAKCVNGICSCTMPVEVEEDLREVAESLTCTRDDSCDYMCAAANSGDCVNGECGCVTPEIIPTFDTRTTLVEEDECSRDSDCDYKCATADSGDCNNGVCGCITPVIEPTITCTDSDYDYRLGGSIVFNVQGTCTVTGSRPVSDYCSGDNLIEYSCSGTYCRTTTKDCSEVGIGYTCASGKCVLGR